MATLRNRELTRAAQDIAADSGLEHRPVTEGQSMVGIYRRSVMLASGRYVVLVDGMGFGLVPWKPLIDQRLGQQIAATVRGLCDLYYLRTLAAHEQLSQALVPSAKAGIMDQSVVDGGVAQATRTHTNNAELQRDEAIRFALLTAMILMLAAGGGGEGLATGASQTLV